MTFWIPGYNRLSNNLWFPIKVISILIDPGRQRPEASSIRVKLDA